MVDLITPRVPMEALVSVMPQRWETCGCPKLGQGRGEETAGIRPRPPHMIRSGFAGFQRPGFFSRAPSSPTHTVGTPMAKVTVSFWISSSRLSG